MRRLNAPEESQRAESSRLGMPELRCPLGAGPSEGATLRQGMATDETPILACSAAHRAVALALQPAESGRAPSEVAVWLAAAQPSVLAHPLQVAVGALAWRAAGLQELAVGCLGGVALWRLPAVVDPTRSGTAIVPGAGTLTWLPAPKALLAQTARVDALAWHPHGHLLAAASSSVAGGFCVYDVARAEATAIKVRVDAAARAVASMK